MRIFNLWLRGLKKIGKSRRICYIERMAGKLDSHTFRVPLERALQRLRELIVYISEKSEHDQYYGATKLNKILYHSDFHSRDHRNARQENNPN
jgi:hypothetical protein